ncbi:MAG TPA: EI24 domain-containing protein [Pilimelia sp.]|nr:EI24 domain-containing protein [Pilimelia sp.]
MTQAVRQFAAGAGLLLRGVALYARSPRLVLLGLIPSLISFMIFATALVVLVVFLSDLAELVTWFADDWSAGWRRLARLAAEAAILGVGALLGVLSFTAVTLLIGDPFYERISERVEDRLGGAPGLVEQPWWRSLRRSAADSARLIGRSLTLGVPLFLSGLIPVVGQFVVPVVGAAVAGWFIAVELVGVPFGRRGMALAERRRALAAHRPLAVGFGVSVFLCFLVPLGAVLLMPAAVAGGTLLARRALGLPVTA